MELYIGGFSQGKLDYVKTKKKIDDDLLIGRGISCSVEELFNKPVVDQFHLFLKRMLEDGQDIPQILNQLMQKNPEVIIICDEVGMGIVPYEKEERMYRETVGRSCCFLARHAQIVERIVCGIGMKLC